LHDHFHVIVYSTWSHQIIGEATLNREDYPTAEAVDAAIARTLASDCRPFGWGNRPVTVFRSHFQVTGNTIAYLKVQVILRDLKGFSLTRIVGRCLNHDEENLVAPQRGEFRSPSSWTRNSIRNFLKLPHARASIAPWSWNEPWPKELQVSINHNDLGYLENALEHLLSAEKLLSSAGAKSP
jgi:hypothetical protein